MGLSTALCFLLCFGTDEMRYELLMCFLSFTRPLMRLHLRRYLPTYPADMEPIGKPWKVLSQQLQVPNLYMPACESRVSSCMVGICCTWQTSIDAKF
jgi:hypothetical protein